ncbi:hypothetical protein JTE90_010646 [Oedothorax gibbosus]|uniref:Chaoptin n=1 Tax=Oedothorax gibbosus TaxID=931172 RepID=A0AAV6UB25_9ARAC|nr:hypothetical protein JTE90_010646 [Oedothorax gibbosus]
MPNKHEKKMRVASLLAVLWVLAHHRASPDPCPFNPLCSCSHRDVSCIGVPFAEVPPLPLDDIFQLTLIKAGVEVLHDHSFQNTRISSLRLMQNQVSHIHSRAFQGSERALTTLDLSFNRMHRLPIEALHRLHHLQWLSLHANDIDEWPPLPPAPHLRSVFAGDNRIAALPEGAFSALRNLSSLDLDSNCLAEVGRASLPSSLHTLSLSNNLLKKVPEAALRHLANLTWLQLGGNLIEDLPKPFRLPVRSIHKLDLSHNLLGDLNNVFKNDSSDPGPTLISNLHLEFNYITQLHASAFAGLSLDRMSLSNNKLSSVPEGVFDGLQDSLKAIDLSHNLLEKFPKALRDLAALSHLFLRGNLIEKLDPQDLYGCRYDLEVLDLSGNRLRRVPSESLRTTQRVARLSLQDNSLSRIEDDDFSTWGHSLTALNLANNMLHHVAPNAFAGGRTTSPLSDNQTPRAPPLLQPPPGTGSSNVLPSGQLWRFWRSGLCKSRLWPSSRAWPRSSAPSTVVGSPRTGNAKEKLLRGSLPTGMFRGALHGRLNSVVLANSGLEEIEADAFHKLPSVTNIVLFGNKLKILRTGSFKDMPLLNTIILAHNEISRLEPAAFTNLRSATHLLLQDNQLAEFSFDAFRQVGDAKSQVLLDLSRNRITELRGLQQDDSSNMIVQKTSNGGGYRDGEVYLRVRTLDLSHNLVSRVDGEFLRPVGRTLHHLVLSHNRIKHLDTTTFQHAPNLQILHLEGNLLSHLPNGAFSVCPGLQAIHVGHNNLSRAFPGAFRNLSALRILDFKRLRTARDLSGDLKLNLSANSVFSVPLPALSHARTTLRYLDLSRNRIGSLPPLGRLHNLLGLNLSGNALKGMAEDAFHQMVYLLHLDLSHNALYRLDEDPFRPLVSLQSLLLSGSRLQQLPAFPLPSLRSLSLAGNALRNVSEESFSRLRELRELDLSRNQLQEVPSHVWGAVGARLARLDLSGNPIQTLSANHFRRLERLRELDLRDLDLKYLDSRILHNLRYFF